ncbi:MAG: endolytic transglycosylase MltG [Paludibacter sp.]|nr:endolytic transglycosylase MltG [Paludibacter sp.]
MNKMTRAYKSKKIFRIFLIILAIASFLVIAGGYYIFLFPNMKHIDKNMYLYIRDNDQFEEVMNQLKEKSKIGNPVTLNWVARLLQYTDNIQPGRYKIENNMSNIGLVRKLRSGIQEPVKLSFNNIRTKPQLAARIGSQIMADSATINTLLDDSVFLNQYGLNSYTSVTLFIPNTYELYWDTDGEELFERMKKEFDAFWNESRTEKAKAIPMTPAEVMTLASIIEEETNKKHEYPIIAGLYINRLKRDMPLQACPTVKFALGDFGLKRILLGHIRTESPYNTYKNTGLPPGPIRIPSITCIDAVLNYEKHNYLFMSAKETFNGEHNFAATGTEHMRNARKYQRALNARGIQ